ncbi:MAG: family protein phosphatase [Eubacteriaceae bacterium]|jgi:protein phosphatase|nr:family protein phosphatase [Eubacteriaceae bacterium]MDK2904076.1 family protein phosphatase [Eubacteriaceae bacterium]MDK2935780.1 family protein phosphatase [Eubacteriaceae bacterium]MDK2961111.1 family protein phosphatase [Eubacteriaceae bacterium]MDN5307185.1 family protein phosphatase [Eubacteriaceae bacterium]
MKCAYGSNVGTQRKVNQDAYLAATIKNIDRISYVFAVADGLGGHRSGEIASQTAVDFIKNNLSRIKDYFDAEEMMAFVNDINLELKKVSDDEPARLGMATTLTMCIVDGDEMCICHVGDSRTYLVSDKEILRLTKDHSLVQILVDEGKITQAEAEIHPQKNVITRALGTDSSVNVDIYRYPIKADAKYLVCSDGLFNMVSDETIKKIVNQNSLEEGAKLLIDTANKNGGKDNITVVLFRPLEGVTDAQ